MKILNIIKNKLFIFYVVISAIIICLYFINNQYGLYAIRWQCSSPTLAIFSAGTIAFFSKKKIKWPNRYEWAGAVFANFVGSNLFFWIDRIIFIK